MPSNFSPYTTPQTNPVSRTQQQAYKPPSFIQAYFSFRGRLNRLRYWMYTLGLIIFIFILFSSIAFLMPTETTVYTTEASMQTEAPSPLDSIYVIIGLISYIIIIWTNLALATKRWHDQGKSGWMNLVYFIPLVGPIWQFIAVGCLPGDMGANQYGPDPLELTT